MSSLAGIPPRKHRLSRHMLRPMYVWKWGHYVLWDSNFMVRSQPPTQLSAPSQLPRHTLGQLWPSHILLPARWKKFTRLQLKSSELCVLALLDITDSQSAPLLLRQLNILRHMFTRLPPLYAQLRKPRLFLERRSLSSIPAPAWSWKRSQPRLSSQYFLSIFSFSQRRFLRERVKLELFTLFPGR